MQEEITLFYNGCCCCCCVAGVSERTSTQMKQEIIAKRFFTEAGQQLTGLHLSPSETRPNIKALKFLYTLVAFQRSLRYVSSFDNCDIWFLYEIFVPEGKTNMAPQSTSILSKRGAVMTSKTSCLACGLPQRCVHDTHLHDIHSDT